MDDNGEKGGGDLQHDPELADVYKAPQNNPPDFLQSQFNKQLRDDIEGRLSRTERRLKWMVPTGIITGLVTGAGIMVLVFSQTQWVDPEADKPKLVEMIQEKTQPTHRHDPDLWLTYIAELIYERKLEEAGRELDAFKQAYPGKENQQ